MDSKQADLKRGWTTGACAAGAAKAACAALVTGQFPDPVTITLPGGQQPAFALAQYEFPDDGARSTLPSDGARSNDVCDQACTEQWAMAAIVKDAGDDPDVTHGALIQVRVCKSGAGEGLVFRAGNGVGTVTLPGLPLAPGEPAINPKPREMIARAIAEVSPNSSDYIIEISVPDGEQLAKQTLNPRLGILGGISILGTTGIVIPFSCAAWIDSIHRGIDVARATGHTHIAAATGDTSEKAVQKLHKLDELQLIDMGDFVGGTLKYIRTHPLPRLTIAGGVAKMTKLAQGFLDLHSKRGRADLNELARLAVDALSRTEKPGGDRRKVASGDVGTGTKGTKHEGSEQELRDQLDEAIRNSNTVAEAFEHARHAGLELGDLIAAKAWQTAAKVLRQSDIELEILIFNHNGEHRGHAPFAPVHRPSRPRKRR